MSALYEMGFVVRVPSWHELETTVFDEYPGREVAFVAAGHDYDVRECVVGDEGAIVDPYVFTGPFCRVPEMDAKGKPTGEWEFRSYSRSEREKGLRIYQVRDGVPGQLHGKKIKHVNKTYEPIQNTVPWDLLDAMLTDETINKGLKLNYETGGVLEGGAACFVTAYLDTPFQIDGDDSKVYPYLFATWRHDAAGALNLGGTSIRIVCANTRGAAESEAEGAGRLYSFKHTKNVMEKVNDAKMAIQGIAVAHEEFHELAEELASITVTSEQRKEFVERFIPYPSSLLSLEGEASDRQVKNIDTARAAVYAALRSKSTPEAHRFTGWGLYNVATEYLDHLRPSVGGSDIAAPRNVESYIKRTITPNRAKNAIVPLIKDVAKVAA
jgi:phage/plasmid-like protein (TIGR03299 family)